MDFAVNYIDNNYNSRYHFDKSVYLKYPGFSASIEEIVSMPRLKNKILLHGIVPSSGSIFDEHLCDKMDEWLQIFKENENKWVSLHFYYEEKFCPLDKAEEVCKSNIDKIRQVLPNIPIVIENVPYAHNDYKWCQEPDVINYYCKKYELGLLLDISHMCVYTGNNNLDINEYLKKLPLDKIYEIHISGCYTDEDKKYYDTHFECSNEIYELYKKVLKIAKNVKMTSLEFPVYNDIPVVIKYLKNSTYDELYKLQNVQLNKLKEIYDNNINRNKI